MTKIVLVTGASGLIGSNLIELLLEKCYFVIGISKSYPLKDFNLVQFSNNNYISLIGDICDKEFIQEVFCNYSPNYIIHLAAQAIVGEGISSADNTYNTNIKGTWNILQNSLNLKSLDRVIIASSDKAYGKHDTLPYVENFNLNAIYPYDLSKKITELIAQSYYKTYNLPISITRCGNVFGQYDLNFSRIIPSTISSCLKGEKIVLRSDGEQHRCYIYSKDVANAYLKIIEAPLEMINGEVFNVGNEQSLSVLNLVNLVCDKMGINPKNQIIINNLSKHEIQNQSLDCSKARRILNWEPQYNLDKALGQTIEWYSKNKQLLSNI